MFNWYSEIFFGCLIVVQLAAVSANDSKQIIKISNVDATSRIVNGTIIPIEEAPYMVQLRYQRYKKVVRFICGGTLISPQHVLTAAHCIYNKTTEGYFIVGGASLKTERGVQRKIDKIFIHPDYNDSNYLADVAVLKLNQTYEEGPKIRVHREFCTAPPPVGKFVKITGWGGMISVRNIVELGVSDYSKELRKVSVPIIADDECKRRVRGIRDEFNDQAEVVVTSTHVCAYDKYADSCRGDSGGPGLYGNALCVIVSYGIGCAYGGYPALYTSYYAVRDFVEESLKAE